MGQFCQIASPSSQKKKLPSIFNFICMYKLVHPSSVSAITPKASLQVGSSKFQRVPGPLTTSAPSTMAAHRGALYTPSKMHSSLKHDEKWEPVGRWWEMKRPYVQHRGVSVTCPVQKDLVCQVVLRPDWEWRGGTCCWGGGNLILSRQSMDGVSRLCNSCCSPATCLINE